MSDEPRPPGEKDPGELPVAWHDVPGGPEQRQAHKRQLLTQALERGKTLVRIDARRPGVQVPERLHTEHALALNLSWRFARTEMVLNERGVAATLRFGGEPFRCVLPWSCLWGIILPGEDALHVWPLDLPVELGGPPVREDGPVAPVEPVRPRLSVVDVRAPEESAAEESRAEESPAETAPAVQAPEAPSGETPSAPEGTPAGESPAPAAQRAPWLRLVR